MSNSKKQAVSFVLKYLQRELKNCPNTENLAIGGKDEILMYDNKDYVDIPLILDKDTETPLDDIVDVLSSYATYVESKIGKCNQDLCIWVRYLWVNPEDSNIKTRKRRVQEREAAKQRFGYKMVLFLLLVALLGILAAYLKITRGQLW